MRSRTSSEMFSSAALRPTAGDNGGKTLDVICGRPVMGNTFRVRFAEIEARALFKSPSGRVKSNHGVGSFAPAKCD